MSCWKFEWKYIREVYMPGVAEEPTYGENALEAPVPMHNEALDVELLKQAHKFAWEAMWREVDAFWVRSGAALVFLGGASSLLFQEGLSPVQLTLISMGVLCMAVVWRQINIGSLSWMASWMTHVDLMEDGITGPLYKTVFHKHTHSTTKSIAHLSMLGVWAATVNLGHQVREVVQVFCVWLEGDCEGMLGADGRAVLIGLAWMACAAFIAVFIRWNISFTRDENKERYLRRVAVGEGAKQVKS